MPDYNPFQRRKKHVSKNKDMEILFKDLSRDTEIDDLLSHQADILRDYQEHHINSKDVGIELPTGSGKTLVGLLIGEWRKINLNQRILYLCPTKQLAYQVNKQSKDYGIDTRLFVGSKKFFDTKELIQYRQSNVIGISTYSGLFNYKPEFQNPQTIICDDAHGAETYIGDLWSLNINKNEHTELFNTLFSIYEADLPKYFVDMMKSERREIRTHGIEKIPYKPFYSKIESLKDAVDYYTNNFETDLWYSWDIIKEGLHSCHMYVSFDNILIRPYIPPTLNHTPFANAEQRIYMSATLGRGGELERITGIREIKRIEKPETFKKRGYGKRLYIFPDYLFETNELNKWMFSRIKNEPRTLVICPNKYLLKNFENNLNVYLPLIDIYDAKDIEESLDPFIKSTNNCILLLSNRYDGLDIPGDKCQNTIIYGIPTGTNLQEQFLEERLGLEVLLTERIKTRIEQASGRCTRKDNDRSVIIMADRRLLDFCAKLEIRNLFHPQIKGEIGLFFEANPTTKEILDTIIKSFIENNEYWASAEEIIAELRDEGVESESEIVSKLSEVVKEEVDFCYDFWNGNFENAIRRGNFIVDKLSGQKLAQYRALWCYFVSNPALILSKTIKDYEPIVLDYLERSKAACSTVSWFPHAVRAMLPETVTFETEEDEITALAVEGIINELSRLGSVGERFHKQLDEIESNLNETEHTKFDNALVKLGTLLGFSAFKPAGKAVPDAAWHLENHMGIVFEAKAGENPEDGISVDNCTQTLRHKDWAFSDERLNIVQNINSVLISPKIKIDREAIPFSHEVNYIHTSEIIALFEQVKQFLVKIRAILTTEIDDNYRTVVLKGLIQNNLLPRNIKEILVSKKASELEIK
ncbi:MAG: DEAD/DEAH box helicase [Candidatus Odinarchaeia archaeon]